MIFEAFAFIALLLSIFNTWMLLKYRIIKPHDIKDLLTIMAALAKLTPTSLDDELIKRLKDLLTKYEKT